VRLRLAGGETVAAAGGSPARAACASKAPGGSSRERHGGVLAWWQASAGRIAVLFTSGYDEHMFVQQQVTDDQAFFMAKP
jgi:hypothetical protein